MYKFCVFICSGLSQLCNICCPYAGLPLLASQADTRPAMAGVFSAARGAAGNMELGTRGVQRFYGGPFPVTKGGGPLDGPI